MRISDWSSDVCSSDLCAGLCPRPRSRCHSRRACACGCKGRRADAHRRPLFRNGTFAEGMRRNQRFGCDAGYRCLQIGRASCRERVCQYVEIVVVAVELKKKTNVKIEFGDISETTIE